MKYLTTKNTWTDNPNLAKKFARMPDLDKLDSSISVFKWQGKFIIGVDPSLQRNGGIFIRLSDGYYSGYPQPQLYGNPTSDKYSLKRNGPFMPNEVSNVFKTHTKMIPHHIAYARGMIDSLVKNPYNWSVDCSAMGQTPNHIEIGYMGAIVWMEPERFLDLCNDLPEEFRRKETIDWAQVQWDNGGLVAPPQLYVRKNDVSSDDPWKVVGHEGRHRATIAKLNNAKQIPVFIYFSDQYGRIQGNEITHDLVKSLQGPVLCESRAKKPSKFVWVDKYWLRGEIWDRFSLIPGPVLCPIDRKNTTIRN